MTSPRCLRKSRSAQGNPPCAPSLHVPQCEAVFQAPAPDLPIERGRPGPGLIANILVGKFCDGLQLYRQSVILTREGIDLDRATLADWLGHAAWWLTSLAALVDQQVMSLPVIQPARRNWRCRLRCELPADATILPRVTTPEPISGCNRFWSGSVPRWLISFHGTGPLPPLRPSPLPLLCFRAGTWR